MAKVIASVFSRAPPTRRETGLWAGSIVFARFLPELELWRLNFFRLFAWIVLFRLLTSSSDLGLARLSDFGVVVVCTLCALLPGDNTVWVVSTLGASYLWFTRDGDAWRASAAVLLFALAVNGLWGPWLFNLLAVWLLDFDAWLVAKVLAVTGALTAFHENQVVVGRGDIEIYGSCSSYHNISLAILIWLTVTKFVRPYWARSDVVFALACVFVTLAWNTLRLVILAETVTDAPTFTLWHTGIGSQFFIAALAFVVAAISVAGASRVAEA